MHKNYHHHGTYTHVLLVLSIGECHVAQFKVSLPVLQHRWACASLPQPALTEDQMMDVATIFSSCLLCNCQGVRVGMMKQRVTGSKGECEREREKERERESQTHSPFFWSICTMSCMYTLIFLTPSGRMGAMAVIYCSLASISVDRLPII